jgi:hypothetical protein
MHRKLFRTLTAALTGVALAAGGVATAGPATASGSDQRGLGYTQVVVAPEVYDLVAGAGITPAPIAPGIAFPYLDTLGTRYAITGFNLANLRIKHAGGVDLSAPGANISLENFWIDLGRLRVSGEVSGTIGEVGRVDLFKIRLSDRLQYGLVKLKLTNTAAGALNATFGVEAFSGGDTFGYATPRPFASFNSRTAGSAAGG